MGAYKQIPENAGDSKWKWLARCWLAVGLTVSALLLVRAMPHSPLRATRPPTKSATVATSTFAEKKATPDVNPATHRTETVYVRKLITQPIETIRVGQRVLGTNPKGDEVEPFAEPDPATWRTIEVEQIKPSGKRLYATLLRPLEWIDEELDPATNTIELDLPELGAEGPATVLRIGPCPPLASGPGQVVTATFRHEPDGELLTVTIGADEIGCTANHPFWSEDRQEFVEAGHLRVGEYVRSRLEQVAAVVSIKPRPPTTWVYNLEVQGEHVYEVGPSGVLVHNKCAGYHHFWPHAWGNKIPYKHPVLTWLTEAEHTDIHRELSKFLFQKTGHYFNSMSGKQWVKTYGKHQLNRWLREFHRDYSKTVMGQAIEKRIGHSESVP